MKAEFILDALGEIDEQYILPAQELFGYGFSPDSRTRKKRHVKSSIKKGLIIIAAVLLLLAFGVTAYAIDLFGIRTLLRPDTFMGGDGQEYNMLSLTQPQNVPAEIDGSLAGKVANSEAAWEEWRRYRETSPYEAEFRAREKRFMADDLIINEDYDITEAHDNGDGTTSLEYYKTVPQSADGNEFMGTKTVDTEEYKMFREELFARARYDGGYDYSYGARCPGEAEVLEQIAAKYDLKLRGNKATAFSSDTTGAVGESFYTNDVLAEMTAEIGNAGNIFYETPIGFDKMYWFDEGTYCVSFYMNLPSDGTRVTCYCYNSMYATLSSGNEVMTAETDLSSFGARSHTAPDGTELTILSNGNSAYIYVYLENSFFAEYISGAFTLTDADLNYIADYINYSLIGK